GRLGVAAVGGGAGGVACLPLGQHVDLAVDLLRGAGVASVVPRVDDDDPAVERPDDRSLLGGPGRAGRAGGLGARRGRGVPPRHLVRYGGTGKGAAAGGDGQAAEGEGGGG